MATNPYDIFQHVLKRRHINAESQEEYENLVKEKELHRNRLRGLATANQNRQPKTTTRKLSDSQHKKKEAFYGRLFGHNPRTEYKVDYYRHELKSNNASKSNGVG